MTGAEQQLPSEILRRADARHGELAWRPSDIPTVIEAARCANLVSLGGDLQVRAPSGLWGEPVGVSVSINLADDLPWETRVEESAKAALADFFSLQQTSDFEAIAREAFASLLAEVADPSEAIFFSWSAVSKSEAQTLKDFWS